MTPCFTKRGSIGAAGAASRRTFDTVRDHGSLRPD